jgi:hypothetical protein
MQRSSRARLLIVAAVLVCVAAVGLIARPPDTPPAIKQTEGWHEWWWTSERVEDPLYRTPQPLGWGGAQSWELVGDARVEVLFRLDLTRDIFAPFAAPAEGRLEIDTRDLDSVTGAVTIDLARLTSHERFFQQGAGDVFSTLDDSVRELTVVIDSAHLGTAPRYPGATARGDLVVMLPGAQETSRAEVLLTRIDDDRITIRTLDPIGCLLPRGFDRLVVLADAWGVPIVPREIAIQLRLELIRGTS